MHPFSKKKFQRSLGIFAGLGHGKEYLVENLSFLISSGIPVVEALRALEAELKNGFLRRIVIDMREGVNNGLSLHTVFAESGLFGEHAISLVKSGEEGGTLSENLRVIAEQDAKNKLFKSRLYSALMYPALVLSVTGVVGIGVAWFILPKLATVFAQLKVKLPVITKVFIGFGDFLNHSGAIAVPLFLVVMACIIYVIFFNKKTDIIGQYFLFSIPGVRKLIQELEIARLGYLLGTLSKAGMPFLQAIESLRESTLSPFYRKFYDRLYKSIEEGNSFEKSFRNYSNINELLPSSIQQIIITGEQSGHLSDVLMQVGNTYEAKTEVTGKNLTVALEPILLIIVWFGVVLVALAVILPIYNLVGNLTY